MKNTIRSITDLMSDEDRKWFLSLPEEIRKYIVQTTMSEDLTDANFSFRMTSLLDTVKKVMEESKDDVELIQEVIELFQCPLLVEAPKSELDIYGREIKRIALLQNGKSYLREFRDMIGADPMFALLGPTFICEFASIAAAESKDLFSKKEYTK